MVFQIEKILQNNENSFPRFDLHLCFSMCNLKLYDVDVDDDDLNLEVEVELMGCVVVDFILEINEKNCV